MSSMSRSLSVAEIWVAGLLLVVGPWIGGCKEQQTDGREDIVVFHADSLSLPFRRVQQAFERAYPQYRLVTESSGSVTAVRKVTDMGRRADIVAVADYRLFDRLMVPQHADWYVCFASNEIVIAYTDASRYADELTRDNWFEILTRDDVQVLAADPRQDPCGYWTELCWMLADLYYPRGPDQGSIVERMRRKCPLDRRPSDTEQILPRLEGRGVDYAFVYRSQALHHHLLHLRLPPQINLGDPDFAERYEEVSIEVPGSVRGKTEIKYGHPIVYAMVVLRDAPHREAAMQFLRFLLGPQGRKLLVEAFLPVLDRPFTYHGDALPQTLRDLVATRSRPTTTQAP